MKKLTQAQKDELTTLYAAGITPTILAEKFGILTNSVVRLLRNAGIERNQLKRVSQEHINQIIDLYNKGISSEIIASHLNITGTTVCRILKRNNVSIRPSSRNTNQHHSNTILAQLAAFSATNTIKKPYNYGTTYIPSFSGKTLDTGNISLMEPKEKEEAAQFLFDYYRYHGFPYTILTNDEILRDFMLLEQLDISETIIENNTLTLYKNAGIDTFKHFSPQFYTVKSGYRNRPSMKEAFDDDDLLKKVIHNRLDSNYNMTGNMLKQGLYSSKIAYRASIFFPHIAKFLYSRYVNDGDIIYDYSTGFGQRLLGALSLPYKVKYVGIDIDPVTIKSNQSIYDFCRENRPMLNKEVDLYCMGAEDFCDEQYHGKVKLAFSSPPYWNVERYSNDTKQAGNQGYTDFLKWWQKVVNNIDQMLSINGLFAINIADMADIFTIKKDMCGIIQKKGFQIMEEYKIQLTRNLKFNNRTGQHKYEPIIVFKRSGV